MVAWIVLQKMVSVCVRRNKKGGKRDKHRKPQTELTELIDGDKQEEDG